MPPPIRFSACPLTYQLRFSLFIIWHTISAIDVLQMSEPRKPFLHLRGQLEDAYFDCAQNHPDFKTSPIVIEGPSTFNYFPVLIDDAVTENFVVGIPRLRWLWLWCRRFTTRRCFARNLILP